MQGRRVAGAGAILWGPPGPDGEWHIVARAVVALLGVVHAQTVEAEGCAAALDLLALCGATLRAARVIGDTLAVVRYSAAQGRLRRPRAQQVIDSGDENTAMTAMAQGAATLAARLHAEGRIHGLLALARGVLVAVFVNIPRCRGPISSCGLRELGARLPTIQT